MPNRNVLITDDHAVMIDHLVESGRYQDTDDVMHEALGLIERREAEDAAKLEALRAAIQVGIDDIDNGRYKEFADTDELVAYLNEITEDIVGGSTEP